MAQPAAETAATEEVRDTPSRFELKPGGYLQADGRFFLGDADEVPVHTFLLRRARIAIDGTIGEWFAARVMADFGNPTTAGTPPISLPDAYADFTPWPWLGLRVGKTKPPFGLERLQSSPNRSLELSIVGGLTPNRDVGVMLFGEIGDGLLEYQLGVFNGVADGGNVDLDIDRGKDLAARIFLRPLAGGSMDLLADLGVGIAITWGPEQEGVDPAAANLTGGAADAATGLGRYRTLGGQTFFRYRLDATMPDTTAVAEGSRLRVSPQLAWYGSRVGVLFEYVMSSTEVRLGTDSDTLTHSGIHALASVFLTDDEASFEGAKPRAPFDSDRGQIGAIELAARFAQITFDEDSFPTYADPARAAERATSFGGGVNWYLNRGVRLSVFFEHVGFDGADLPDEDLIVTRAQARF